MTLPRGTRFFSPMHVACRTIYNVLYQLIYVCRYKLKDNLNTEETCWIINAWTISRAHKNSGQEIRLKRGGENDLFVECGTTNNIVQSSRITVEPEHSSKIVFFLIIHPNVPESTRRKFPPVWRLWCHVSQNQFSVFLSKIKRFVGQKTVFLLTVTHCMMSLGNRSMWWPSLLRCTFSYKSSSYFLCSTMRAS